MSVNQAGVVITLTSLILWATPARGVTDSFISDSSSPGSSNLSISDLASFNSAADLLATPNSTPNRSQASSQGSVLLHAQSSDPGSPQTEAAPTDVSPTENFPLEESPVFRRWQQRVPNVLDEIRNDPSFRTRARLGLSYFPSTYDSLGWNVGIEDIFLGESRFTLSGDYQATFTGDRKAGGAELRYYLLPLGGYVNLAPVIGYRYLETPRYVTDGLNVGARLQFVPSRTGGADISLTQTWVAPQQSEEVGITKLSFGYALTRQLRISTDIERQNSKQKKDTRFGISLEWMF